jgi:uncharacterized radical SAM superfamily Fe-S cluster-containing enzyme
MYASLQFDTLKPGVYPKLRGVELIDMKMKCVEVISELDIPTVLVPTISRGDNSDELGALIDFGVNWKQVSSSCNRWRTPATAAIAITRRPRVTG